MIVPLEFKIERVELPESDVDRYDRLQWGLPSLADTPVYSVLATLYDTESEEVKTYDLHTLVDRSHEPPRIGMITHSPLEANREYLTGVRDQLNEVLAGGDESREGFLAARLRSMAQTMTQLEGDEFHYLCEAARLLAEKGAS